MTGAYDSETEAGFSVVEMLVITAILAMAVAVAQPLMRGQPDRLRFDAAVGRILDAVKSTRASAIAGNSEMTLVFDLDRRQFYSGVVAPTVLPGEISVRLKVAALTEATLGSGRIVFFPDGSSTGAEILVSMKAFSSAICVNWITGIPHGDVRCAGS